MIMAAETASGRSVHEEDARVPSRRSFEKVSRRELDVPDSYGGKSNKSAQDDYLLPNFFLPAFTSRSKFKTITKKKHGTVSSPSSNSITNMPVRMDWVDMFPTSWMKTEFRNWRTISSERPSCHVPPTRTPPAGSAGFSFRRRRTE